MKMPFIILLVLICSLSLKAQYSVSNNAALADADLAVSINTSTANANISVMIGDNLNNRNFAIGFTDTKSDADIIITDNLESDLKIVKCRLSEADVSVKYGESIINPDVRIEVIEDGTVDFLIYNESESFDIEPLILALLPIINAYMGHPYEVIPYWVPEGGEVAEEEVTVNPTMYAGTDVAHWIFEIENGVIRLEDLSLFYVYDEDRYISDLWQKNNNVIVQPTEVSGHYYISKSMGENKEAEIIRAICVQGL